MHKILSFLFCIAIGVSTLSAASPDDEPDVLDMSLDQSLAYPEVPGKAKAYVRTAMDAIRRSLNKNGFEASATRDGEVVEFSVPCDRLFAPGSLELKSDAARTLAALGPVIRDNSLYRVLVAVHTDDTGDDLYADSISASRANALDDLLWSMAGEIDTNIVPYGIGKDDPVAPNNTIMGRRANRRVEFFIVPDVGLLTQAGVKPKQPKK